MLSGTPTTAGTSTFTITASNGVAPDATQTHELTINPAQIAPVITSGSPPAGTAGQAYSFTFVANGVPTPTWSATGVPAGLALDSGTGVLSGMPTTAGTTALTIRASNGVALDAVQTYQLTISPAPAGLTFIPAQLDFGNQAMGSASAARAVTVKNNTTSDIRITGVSVSNPQFAVAPATGTGACQRSTPRPGESVTTTIRRGETCTLGSVVYTPTTFGPSYAIVTLTGQDKPTNPTWKYGITGNGIHPLYSNTVLSFTPQQLDFGNQAMGSASAARAVTVKNNTTSDIRITGVSVSNPQFAVAPATGTGACQRATPRPGESVTTTIRRGETCTLGSVVYTPTTFGPSYAIVTLTGQDKPTNPTWKYGITGNGIHPLYSSTVLSFTPQQLDFGNQAMGSASAARAVTVKNNSTSDIRITGVSVSNPQFAVAPATGTGACQRATPRPGESVTTTIRRGETCTLGSVVYTPTTFGPSYAIVTLTGQDKPTNPTWKYGITGNGILPIPL